MEMFRRFFRSIFRTKVVKFDHLRARNVPRFKELLHLLVQGLGSGSALGIYVYIAVAARDHAGPAVILSALGAAVLSWICGSCYSELACRLPLMGSSCLYSYTVFGEIVGFVSGWNLIIESLLGIALASTALSNHLNMLSGGQLKAWIKRDLGVFPWDSDNSPQIIAGGIILFISVCSLWRSKNVALTVHSCLFVLHMLVIIAMAFLAMFHVKPDNWGTDETFFRNGFGGIISAGALLLASATGIKSIAMAAEETRKPSRNIPISHTMVTVITFVALFVLSALTTLSYPVELLSFEAPLLTVFDDLRVRNAKYFIGVGCVSGFVLSIVAQLNYAERMLFSLARNGLLPRKLSGWSYRTNTPWTCRIILTAIAFTVSVFVKFEHLLQTAAISVLFSYALTCMATVIMRYDPCQIGLAAGNPLRKTVSAESFIISRTSSQMSELTTSSGVSQALGTPLKETSILLLGTAEKGTSTSINLSTRRDSTSSNDSNTTVGLPDLRSYRQVTKSLWVSVIVSILLGATLRFCRDMPVHLEWLPVTFSLTLVFANICCSLFVFRAPTNGMPLVYSAGGMPFLQMLAVMCLSVMLFHLPAEAWIRWTVSTFLGAIVYFCYSWRRSLEGRPVIQEMFFENYASSGSV